MHNIIFDCDNTMGLPNRVVDDGLAILFLLGRKDINIKGITTTFGNDNVDVVYKNTVKFMDQFENSGIPVLKGSGLTKDRKSDASKFLVHKINEHPGGITLLATGALSNVYGAYLSDNHFFKKLKEIVVMGGITEQLVIAGKDLREINFSCDPEASFYVLHSGAKTTIINAHLCLNAFFGEKELERLRQLNEIPIFKYIYKMLGSWREVMKAHFGFDGFYIWDVVAAMFISNPELFDHKLVSLLSTKEDLNTGNLLYGIADTNSTIIMPDVINNIDAFYETLFTAWGKVKMK